MIRKALLLFGLTLIGFTSNLFADNGTCSDPFENARRHQQQQSRWINTYGVRSVINQGETTVVPVGKPYFVSLSHNSGLVMEGGFTQTFPTPLLAISPGDGIFSKFYAQAMQSILKETYTTGRHPMPASLAATEVAYLSEAKMNGDPRQIFYFTRMTHATSPDRQVGAFAEVYDTTPIHDDAPLTALENRLGWQHPDRNDPNHIIIELRRGYVGPDAEVQELEQSQGLMRKVASYIHQQHISKGRKVTILSLTFDEVRERALSSHFGFSKIPNATPSHSPWRVMQCDGENFVERFGSDTAMANYHLSYRSTGSADPLFSPKQFQTVIQETTTLQQTRYDHLSQLLQTEVHVADPAGGPPLMSHDELGTFTQHMDGLFMEQRSQFPLVWF